MVNMRKEGKGWEEIEKAWTAVTGQVPGKDVLRKKESKLKAVAVRWKAGDVSSSHPSFQPTSYIILMYV